MRNVVNLAKKVSKKFGHLRKGGLSLFHHSRKKQKNTMKNARVATAKDFKLGTTLITSEGYEFTIYGKYDNGVWEARSRSGAKCVFESEARFYKVAI